MPGIFETYPNAFSHLLILFCNQIFHLKGKWGWRKSFQSSDGIRMELTARIRTEVFSLT
jgi:hypothetical protein